MNLDKLNQLIEERTEEVFYPDRKDWVEQLCVMLVDGEENEDDDWNSDYYSTSTNIFVCKDREDTWEPKIFWVKVSKSVFWDLLKGIKDDHNFILRLEWGNDSGLSNKKLTIRSVTEYYVYLSPEGWEEDEDE